MDIASYIQSYIADTKVTNDVLETNREMAMRYYVGGQMGNERTGRSSVIMTEVRDTIDWLLPQLTEVFCGERSAVDFLPRHDDPENAAKIETAYVNWVINTKNPGFLIYNNWFQDALLLKNGYIKAYWKDYDHYKIEEYNGQNIGELSVLMNDASFQIQGLEEVQDEATGQPIYNVKGRRKKTQGKICIENLPPENVQVDRNWRELCLQNCPFVAHYERKTRSDLISDGFDKELIESLPRASDDSNLTLNVYRNRDIDGNATWTGGDIYDSEKVGIYECYVLFDSDGDGIPERRKVLYEENSKMVILDEPSDHVPIISLTPSPIAHRHYGSSIFDRVRELQNIKTAIMRQMLDNLYLANNPRILAKPDAIEMNDLLNPTVGGVIRAKPKFQQGDLQMLTVPFVAQQAFPMLEYMDAVKEQRTGVSKQTQGLDPSALKDQSIYGMSTLMEAAQQKIRYIARVFGETGVKELVNMVRMLAAKYAKDEEVFSVAGEFATIDPRQWTKERDVYVTVGVGNTAPDSKMKALAAIQALQERVIQAQNGATAGQQAVVVNAVNAYNMISDTLDALGIYNVGRYFNNPKPMMDMLNEMADTPPPPDPAIEIAKGELSIKESTELVKAQLDKSKHQDELDVKAEEMKQRSKEIEIEEYRAQTDRINALTNQVKVRVDALSKGVSLDVASTESAKATQNMVDSMAQP